MRIVIISDTHGQQDVLPELSGDVLIHCGDLCGDDDGRDLPHVDAWFAEQDFPHRLAVAGNHDFLLQRLEQLGEPTLAHATLLHDQSISIEGLKFYGAPWLPDLPGWAYHLDDDERKAKWEMIPLDTDVLITHTPPAGILDQKGDEHLGCPYLRDRVFEVRPRLHCFGHVHASFGEAVIDGVRFINASQIRSGRIVNSPVTFEFT